jgi:hypothetical protein
MTQYIIIIGLVIVIGVLSWNNWHLVQDNKNMILENRIKADKANFVLRELKAKFEKGNYKKAVFLGGIIEALEWSTGKREDDQFRGWVLANKRAKKG